MNQCKSIENSLVLSVIATINAIILLFILKDNISIQYLKLIFIAIFVVNIFVGIILANLERIKLLFCLSILTFISYSVLALSFRYIRNFFPKPSMEDAKVIGFANYFGYPLSFDIFLFLLIILLPLIFYIILKLRLNDS